MSCELNEMNARSIEEGMSLQGWMYAREEVKERPDELVCVVDGLCVLELQNLKHVPGNSEI